MTVLVSIPLTVACPHCKTGDEVTVVSSSVRYCWGCGQPINVIHESCICGKPAGHGRHKGPHGLAYYCRCGFVATMKEEIMVHMEAVR